MTFQEQLNLYMEELSCSGRELAKNSGISETILSRYRKGERIPGADSDYLKKLAAGIALTAEQKGKKIDQERALEALLAALKQEEKTEIFYYQKFDILLRELEINVSKMASALHYDPSYISKIRTGKRTPSDVRGFAENVCGYIVRNFSGQEERRYLRQTAANLCPRLLAALDRGELRYVFCSLAGERKAQF